MPAILLSADQLRKTGAVHRVQGNGVRVHYFPTTRGLIDGDIADYGFIHELTRIYVKPGESLYRSQGGHMYNLSGHYETANGPL